MAADVGLIEVSLAVVHSDVPTVDVDGHLKRAGSVRTGGKTWRANKPICSRLCFRSTFHFIRSARFNINAAVELDGVKPHSSAIFAVRDGNANGSINGLARDDAIDDERDDDVGRGSSTMVVVFGKDSTCGCQTCRNRAAGVRGR